MWYRNVSLGTAWSTNEFRDWWGLFIIRTSNANSVWICDLFILLILSTFINMIILKKII